MGAMVKICGLTRSQDVECALDYGADFIGLVFYPPSPRSVSNAVAADLALLAAGRAKRVGVMVDPSDDRLDAVLSDVDLDIIQLHGHEPPGRVETIKSRTGKPVMKALRVADEADLEVLPAYSDLADMILFDAKPPADPNSLPGGNGLRFDWRLLAALELRKDWAVAGGLTVGNVEEAIALTRAPIVDVSSGVEAAPGAKNPELIRSFLATAKRVRSSNTAAA